MERSERRIVNRGKIPLFIEFPGHFIGTDPVHALGTEQGRHLLLLAQETLQGTPDGIGRNMRIGEKTVRLLLQVVRRRGGAETDARDILFIVILKRLRLLASRADAYQEHTRSQRIQRTGMADFQVFLAKVTDGRPLELTEGVGRGPAERLVHRQDNALRIIC